MKLSKDDILNSVEYQWRKHQLILYFYIWLIISIITIFIPLALAITDLENIVSESEDVQDVKKDLPLSLLRQIKKQIF